MIQIGSDHAKAADHVGSTDAHIRLTGNIVKVDPGSVLRCNDSLCAKHHTVFRAAGKRLQRLFDLLTGEFLCRFLTKA